MNKPRIPFNRKTLYRYIQPTIISVFVFAVLIIAATFYTHYKKGLWEKDIRTEMLNFMMGKKSNLEKALYSRIYYTRGVAAYVALNPGIKSKEFAELAKEYMGNDTVISTLALSKDCILNEVYPLEGHEAALGLNLLRHPARKKIVEKTIETQLTFVAGPVELVEGGIAFISYTPIFNKTKNNEKHFWGVTDIVIKQNSLFNEAKLEVSEAGFNFALKGYDGTGKDGDVFWGDGEIFEHNPVTINIDLPIGNWVFAAVPSRGWHLYSDQDKTLFVILFISAFIISFLIWLFSKALLRIKNNEKELKAVFESLDSLIIEFNAEGDYLKMCSSNNDLLYLPEEKLKGKNIDTIFDKEQAKIFKEAIQNCVVHKKLVVVEYPMQIKGREFWFSSRISYKSDNSVIVNAYDITKKKKQENSLIRSEQQLKELNSMKDKFFSIIAHDLRGPLGGQKSLIDFILDEYDDLDEATRKEMIISLQESSNSVYTLLENLLNWSMSQSGKIEVNNIKFNLYEDTARLLTDFTKEAELKNIQLQNNLDENTIVFADVNLTETILRNLISNAIKFTQPGGKIQVYSELSVIDGKEYQNICVTDNGVGIEEKKLGTLFRLDKAQSTPGTSNEKGNGLGLLLCKELAELQGSKMNVLSTQKTGSIFSFILPTA
ncbi:MAG: ATP-binding protein [Draconibacterium sp.]|nr:ATP-binding protein [Draconibacterium sp.]